MLDIASILFGLFVFDAIVLLAFGVAVAVVIMFNIQISGFMERIPRALGALFLTSMGAGAILWGAGRMFGGI